MNRKHVVIKQVGRLPEEQDLATQALKAHELQLAPEGIEHDLTAVATGIGRGGFQTLLQRLVEANGEQTVACDSMWGVQLLMSEQDAEIDFAGDWKLAKGKAGEEGQSG